MPQKKNPKKYNVVIPAILLLTLLGVGLILQAYRHYMEDVIRIQDDKQLQLALAVDRNIGSLLTQTKESLTYVIAQPEFRAAEETWRQGGSPDAVEALLRESPLLENELTRDIVAVQNEKLLFAVREAQTYTANDPEQQLWMDAEGKVYLAMYAPGAGDIRYALLLDIQKLYQKVSSAKLAESDQLLLLDRSHYVMLHFCTDENEVKCTKIEACPKREDFRILIEADTEGKQACFPCVYQTRRMETGYNAHITTIPGGMSSNGSFAVGLINNIDEVLLPLRTASLRWLLGGIAVLAGISLLLILLLHYRRKDAQIERELELLRQKNLSMEELNRKTQEMAHHQRLEMIGTLASGIAHEFNNLLTPIMGYSMLTLEQLPPEQEALYDNILEIYNTSRKAREITSQLSQYARKTGGETKEYLQPGQLLRRVLHVAMPACPEGVKVDLQIDCGKAEIYGNATQLSQLFLNLMLNAFHAMGEGGRLTITGRIYRGQVCIEVQDNGCGIPEAVLPHIFEPFYTTKEGGQGTGLGLAIAQQIIEDHQGHIEVSSTVGEGSRFTVLLPVHYRLKTEES